MINNIIEIWYWTIILATLIGVVMYWGIGYARDLWSSLMGQRNAWQTGGSNGKAMEPYSRRMVTIHWLTLALLIVTWYLGDVLVDARNEKSATLTGYFAHVLAGGAVLLLTLLRLTYRSVDKIPPPLGFALMDMVAGGVHYLLYILLILLSLSGFMTLLTSSVGEALLVVDAGLLPTKYTGPGVIPHAVHETLVTVLITVVAMHILGVIKHQFIMKDGLMRRMSLRKKGGRSA
ncbi:MAG: hypothetical protein EPN14_03220 [Gallionella sp.]|nr:MAG: hypothetical protein EPN14_03220 [Gallionella sp.]